MESAEVRAELVRPWSVRAGWAVLASLVCGCGAGGESTPLLGLLQASPEAGSAGVFLNEGVQMHFSSALDPTSLHARSARIVDAFGQPARGQWEVLGTTLTFWPDPVLSPQLDDGGYRPGETYTVELAGFPRPDGLRDLDGVPLAQSVAWSFRVVDVDDPIRRGFLFEDSSLDTGRPLVLRSERIGPRDPILLEGEEPVDPSTLFGEDFVLQAWRRSSATALPGDEEAQTSTEWIQRIPVRARLLDNRDRRGHHSGGRTWIELQPEEPLGAGPEFIYQIQLANGSRLRDFSGHPVLILPRSTVSLSHLRVEAEGTSAPLVFSEHFLGTENRSSFAVPEADGTAWWGGESGRVEVRFPAAAGLGGAGRVALGSALPERDVHATRLTQAADVVTDLGRATGPVVLRAQGALHLHGRLKRQSDYTEVDFLPGETLSAWLERMREEGRPVTVLIAGGDIVLAGHIDVSGPLILAAGGRVRLQYPQEYKRITAASMHLVGERLGQGNFYNYRTDAFPTILAAPLVLDRPETNPLVEPLTFAVRSGPIPREGRVKRWHPLQIAPGGHAGAGGFSVRFVGERSPRSPDQPAEIIKDDPVQLGDCPTLSLQVELRLEPGPTWDPPWVDFVELSWEFAEAEGGR